MIDSNMYWKHVQCLVVHLRFRNIITRTYFRRVRKFAKSVYKLRHVCPSVFPPHGSTRLSYNGFSWNFEFDYFSKMCRDISSFIKIWQEERVVYWRSVYIYDNLSLISSENEKYSQQKLQRKSKHMFYAQGFSGKWCHLSDNVGKYRRAR